MSLRVGKTQLILGQGVTKINGLLTSTLNSLGPRMSVVLMEAKN